MGPAGVPNTYPIEGEAVPPPGNSADSLIPGEERYLNIAVNIPAFAVRDGLYRLQFELDGNLVRELPLPVVVIASKLQHVAKDGIESISSGNVANIVIEPFDLASRLCP